MDVKCDIKQKVSFSLKAGDKF